MNGSVTETMFYLDSTCQQMHKNPLSLCLISKTENQLSGRKYSLKMTKGAVKNVIYVQVLWRLFKDIVLGIAAKFMPHSK